MATPKPALSTWTGAAIDAVKSADPLKQKGKTQVTDVASLFESVQTDFVAALRGGKQPSIGIPLFGKIGLDGKLNISKEALLSRVMSFGYNAVNEAGGADIVKDVGKKVSSVLATAEKSVMGGLLGTFNQSKDEVYVLIDGEKKELESSNLLSKVNSIGASINAFTGTNTFKIKDASGQAAMMRGLITQSLKNGIPNTFKALTKDIVDPRNLRKMAGNVLGDVVKSVDIKSILGVGNLLGKGGPALSRPMVTREMALNFDKIPGETTDTLKTKLGDVTDFFNICAPTKGVEGEGANAQEVHYVAPFTSGSEHFKNMVDMGAKEAPSVDNSAILLASKMSPKSAWESLQEQYPSTVFGSRTRTA